MTNIIFHPDMEHEVKSSYIWYQNKANGLGEDFLSKLEVAYQAIEDVSSRKRILKLSPLNEREIRELLNAFYSVCRWVPIYFLWRPNLRDENDNFLIELALAGNCKIVVTNNIKDLANAELKFAELRVLKPEQLLRGD